MYQTQYGPQGASRFADFIGTAFNPVDMGGMEYGKWNERI